MRCNSKSIVAACLALSLGACDATSPEAKELVDFVLDFCSDGVPAFVAFQNDGGPWTRVTPNASGTVTIQATPKFALAVAGDDGSGTFTDVVYGTRDEFSTLNGNACLEEFGAKALNGSVSGVTLSQIAQMTLSMSSTSASGSFPQFTLNDLPDRPMDLIAHRASGTGNQVPDKMIVRRAVNLTNGATIPVLDFNAADAMAIATNTLSVTGLASGETNFLLTAIRTALGTSHTIYSALFSAGNQTIYGVPASLTQSGDAQEVIAFAISNNTPTARAVAQYHRNPGDRSAAFGATLSTPTVSSAATTPSLRMRAQLPSQADYGAFASVNFTQSPSGGDRNFSVTKTAGYVGSTPATWDLEMPDLSGVSGFPTGAAFENGIGTDWFIQAASAGPDVYVGGMPAEGLLAKFADRSSAFEMRLIRTEPTTRRTSLLRRIRLSSRTK